MIERDITHPLDVERYFVLAQDEDKDDKGKYDKKYSHIDYYTNIELAWSCEEEDGTFSNQEQGRDELFEALRTWRPYEERDWSMELKTLFEEEDGKDTMVT